MAVSKFLVQHITRAIKLSKYNIENKILVDQCPRSARGRACTLALAITEGQPEAGLWKI